MGCFDKVLPLMAGRQARGSILCLVDTETVMEASLKTAFMVVCGVCSPVDAGLWMEQRKGGVDGLWGGPLTGFDLEYLL